MALMSGGRCVGLALEVEAGEERQVLDVRGKHMAHRGSHGVDATVQPLDHDLPAAVEFLDSKSKKVSSKEEIAHTLLVTEDATAVLARWPDADVVELTDHAVGAGEHLLDAAGRLAKALLILDQGDAGGLRPDHRRLRGDRARVCAPVARGAA